MWEETVVPRDNPPFSQPRFVQRKGRCCWTARGWMHAWLEESTMRRKERQRRAPMRMWNWEWRLGIEAD
uniref:Uncharacterized protein n=1 Tax=Hippocampus comes TaxID=109280 RepID=A0A3Q2YVS4_HIPCM